jgi:hypothetical protein
VTGDHLVDRVSNQEQVHDRIEYPCRERVVAGEDDDLPPLALGVEEGANRWGVGLSVGHGQLKVMRTEE